MAANNNFDIFSLSNINISYSDPRQIRDFILKELLLLQSKPVHIVTFNLDFYRIALENTGFYDLCKNADIIFPDGAGITSLIKLIYNRSIKRITGSDLLDIILLLSEQKPFKLALVGSSETALKIIRQKITINFPNVNLVNTISPPMFFEEDLVENMKIVCKLKDSNPDILLVALGCPRQEMWISKYKDEIGAKINIGIGGVFDFYSGLKIRSPQLLQDIGLEWLWRLSCDPVRLYKRYLIYDCPFYIKMVMKALFNS
ncbi:MAG: WecB/TagA/CpsF family glycosyltransferase [Ignavibacteria bacterium]